MTPVKFTEANIIDATYSPARFRLDQKMVREEVIHEWSISCWRLSFWERVQLLFTGRIWALRTDRTTELTLNKEEVIK